VSVLCFYFCNRIVWAKLLPFYDLLAFNVYLSYLCIAVDESSILLFHCDILIVVNNVDIYLVYFGGRNSVTVRLLRVVA